MNTRSLRLSTFLMALAVLVIFASPKFANAQQVTYYTFDDGPNSYSNGCIDSPSAGNALLCLNNGTGSAGTVPAFIIANQAGHIGESCHEGDTHCPYTDSDYHTALQMTTAGSQGSSVWFSIPQKVTTGFTNYFAFRITPNASSTPADGLAFVVQNSRGTAGSASGVYGSGPTVRGEIGGSMAYGGLDNSLAVEFDTYLNTEYDDPPYGEDGLSNHIAVQSCGSGFNSPDHGSGGCLVGSGINASLPANLADGRTHEVVVEYTGPADAETDNYFVYLDPDFVEGTHTPVTGTEPTVHVHFNFSDLTLLGADHDSAYVGFTAATGAAYETANLLAWTFTPHVPVTTEPQPIVDGTPTTFPFGAHTYAATYPADSTDGGTDMIATANTISPGDFLYLVGGTAFAGSHCQIYEGTGGNCIIYSIHCVQRAHPNVKVECPTTEDPTIQVKTAYESDDSVPSLTHGFLRGDPFYSPIDTVQGDGAALTATVSCTGSCSVSDGQTVSVRNNTSGLNAENVVVHKLAVDRFTYPLSTASTANGTGGYVTSDNVQNICNPPGSDVPCWQAQRIDGTTTGRTKNFSDLAALLTTGSTPAFTSGNATTFTTGAAGTFPITTAGFNFPTITRAGALPGGVSFVDNGDGTATLAGTPDPGSQGSYPLHFDATDAVHSHATQDFTLNVSAGTVQVTVNTSPGGRSFSVDSHTYTSSQTLTWNLGSTHTIATTSPQTAGAGTQYVFANWSDGGALSHEVTANSATTYTATFNTQYQLTTAVSPAGGGTVTPASGGFYNAGTSVPLSASANAGFAFTNWTGAVASSTSASTTITMNAPQSVTANFASSAKISITPNVLDFGDVVLGTKTQKTVTVKNISTAALKITNITFIYGTGPSRKNYGYTTQCGGTINPGKTCTIAVELKAQDVGPGASQLSVVYNSTGSPVNVALSGNVINPKAKVSPSSLSFGNQKVNTTVTKTVVLTSSGDTPLVLGGIALTGSSDFTQTNNCSSPLPKNASCTVTVAFKPTAKQSRSGTLKITDNASSSPQTVSLSGKGN